MDGNGQARTKRNPRGGGRPKESRKHIAWMRLQENILGIGAARFWEELNRLEGRDYIIAWLSVLRYFKPALASRIADDITDIPTIELVDGLKEIAEHGKHTNDGNSGVSRELP